jgi:hypothetical protein
MSHQFQKGREASRGGSASCVEEGSVEHGGWQPTATLSREEGDGGGRQARWATGQSSHELLGRCRAVGEKRIEMHGADSRWVGCGEKEWWVVVKGQASRPTGPKERRNTNSLSNLVVNFLKFESNKILQFFIRKIGGKI